MIKVTKLKLSRKFPFLLRHQRHPSKTNPSPAKTLPPIETLPPEILSNIFALCCFCEDNCQNERFNHVPINVSQVSRRWREIALTTPRIWSFLAYKEDRDYYISAYRRPNMPLEIWRLWGERSKAVGLSLRFRDFPRAMYSSSDIQEYLNVAHGQGMWWRELYMDSGYNPLGLQVLELDRNLLGELEVLHTEEQLLSFVQLDGPRLRLGTFSSNALVEGDLSIGSKLQDFDFTLTHWPSRYFVDMDNMITLIHSSSCHLSRMAFNLSPFITFTQQCQIRHEIVSRLRDLTLTGNITAARSIMDSITAPALERLQLQLWDWRCSGTRSGTPIESRDKDSIRNFLARSSSPLSEFQLYVDGWGHEDLRDIVSLVPQLRHLKLATNGEGFWTCDSAGALVTILQRAEICPELEYVEVSHRDTEHEIYSICLGVH